MSIQTVNPDKGGFAWAHIGTVQCAI